MPAAQLEGLGDLCGAEPRGSACERGAGRGHEAVAVRVRLDDGHDLGVLGTLDEAGDVAADGGEIDDGAGRVHKRVRVHADDCLTAPRPRGVVTLLPHAAHTVTAGSHAPRRRRRNGRGRPARAARRVRAAP